MLKTDRTTIRACSLSELLRKLEEFQTKYPNVKPSEVVVLMPIEALSLEFQREATEDEKLAEARREQALASLKAKIAATVSKVPDKDLYDVLTVLESYSR